MCVWPFWCPVATSQPQFKGYTQEANAQDGHSHIMLRDGLLPYCQMGGHIPEMSIRHHYGDEMCSSVESTFLSHTRATDETSRGENVF